MQIFFNVCFGVGAGYTIISFFIGEIFDIGNFDSHFDFGTSISPLKPSVIAAFLTVFGGIGSLLIKDEKFSLMLIIIISFIIAFLIAYILYRLVIVPLSKAQNTSAVEKQSLIGLTAKVTVKIPQGKFGKITYYVNGNTYSAPAKAENGCEIEKYEAVEIILIQKNIFYVRKKN